MTIVAGFPGNGFVVLAADSDEAYAITKSSIRKLAMIDAGDCKCIIGGAGHGDTIDLAVQMVRGELQPPYSMQGVCERIEQVVTHIYSTRIDSYPESLRRALGFELLCAVWVKDYPAGAQLIRVRRAIYLFRNAPEAIGAGAELARYLIATLAPDSRSIAQAYRMAVYLIEQVKRHAVDCGGDTQVIGIGSDGRIVELTQTTIKQYEESASIIMGGAMKFLFYLTDPIAAQINKVEVGKAIDFATAQMKEQLAKLIPQLRKATETSETTEIADANQPRLEGQ